MPRYADLQIAFRKRDARSHALASASMARGRNSARFPSGVVINVGDIYGGKPDGLLLKGQELRQPGAFRGGWSSGHRHGRETVAAVDRRAGVLAACWRCDSFCNCQRYI